MDRKAVLYGRTSTPEQHLESQFIQLRDLVSRRGLNLIAEYSDKGISGSKAKRPGIDALLRDAHRGKFSVIVVAAFDRLARSVKNLLALVDEQDTQGVEIISAREAVDTSTATGRMFVTVLGSIAELEKSFIRERIRAGMRRRKLEGLSVGRQPIDVDHDAIVSDRHSGMSLTAIAQKYSVSRPSVVRWVRDAKLKEAASASIAEGNRTEEVAA